MLPGTVAYVLRGVLVISTVLPAAFQLGKKFSNIALLTRSTPGSSLVIIQVMNRLYSTYDRGGEGGGGPN